jgi:hypothetical protein
MKQSCGVQSHLATLNERISILTVFSMTSMARTDNPAYLITLFPLGNRGHIAKVLLLNLPMQADEVAESEKYGGRGGRGSVRESEAKNLGEYHVGFFSRCVGCCKKMMLEC